MKFLLLFGLVLGSSAFVKRDVGTTLFPFGQEIIYDFNILTKAGSDDFVEFASSYNIVGDLHVAATASEINCQLVDLKFGAYNGEFDSANQPNITFKAYDQLRQLTEPFQVQVSNGKAVGIILNSNVDKWAQNIMRGIATALQIDLNQIGSSSTNFVTDEETVVGNCKTNYILISTDDDTVDQVQKYRTQANCNDVPKRVLKMPGVGIHNCPDDRSTNALNSNGYGIYDFERKNGVLFLKNIKVGSSVNYNILGTDGHTQYSYSQLSLSLKKVNDEGSVPAPSNPKIYDDLKFKFLHDLTEDEDIRKPLPFYFHKGGALNHAEQAEAGEQLVANIKKLHESLKSIEVYKDTNDFHDVSPLSLIPYVATLDYQHLTEVYKKVKGGDETEYKLFLDSLVLSGTGPAALVIRDIVASTHETLTIVRIIAKLPIYIINPTENLLLEFEKLIKPENNNVNGRIIEFAFASLLGRTCKSNGCQKSGLLEKWVKYWSDQLESDTSFEEKTEAVIALRNINLVPAAEKLLAVFKNKTQERSLRSAALSGVKALLAKDFQTFKKHVLPVFFDKQEDSELRNVALQWTMLNLPDENMFTQVAISMWNEKDPEVKNFVKTLFVSIAETTLPCLLQRGLWAKIGLQMMQSGETKDQYSGIYISDYHDHQYNFGHMSKIVIQKNGNSLLPRTIDVGFNGQAAGLITNYFSLFLRLEGLGKSITSRLMSMSTGVIDFDEIYDIFKKIGVQERQPEPLRIEFAVMLHGCVIAYYAVDENTVTSLPQLMKTLGELKYDVYDKEFVHMALVGVVHTERPNELGLPVSTFTSVDAMVAAQVKVSSDMVGTKLLRNYETRLQLNLHGISSVNNHLTPFGTAHSVQALRTLRIRIPRKMSIGMDIKQQSINFVVAAPTEDNPLLVQTHATALTSVSSDAPIVLENNEVVDVLREACPDCKSIAVISKGKKYREERRLGSGHKFLEGISTGAKYYDCEKIHSRIHVLKQKFFGLLNKNLGGLRNSLTLANLGGRYAIETLFFSPPTETCGLKAWFSQDLTAQSVFDKVEGEVNIKQEIDPKEKMGSKLHLLSSLNFTYIGAVPKTKTTDIGLSFVQTGIEKKKLKIKLAAKDETDEKSNVMCIDVNSVASTFSDFFAYDGENEATFDRNINISWGENEKSNSSCPTGAGIKINRKSWRSQKQKEDVESNVWPYKQCREHKNSSKYPGGVIPPTEPCLMVALQQTNLRESNLTIAYKVDPETQKRWKYPAYLVTAFLMPYLVPRDSINHHAPQDLSLTEDGFIQGEINIDVSVDEQHPKADIYFHSSQGEQVHYQGVDLRILPESLRSPVFSRFSTLELILYNLKVFGYCAVTPHALQTHDNVTYFADISDCSTLLSGDCSEKPRYVVLGKRIANDKLAVTIIMGNHTIKLDNLNTATMDGKTLSLSDKFITPEGDSKIFKMYKHDENNVFVLSQPLSVFIHYTEYFVTVKLGSRYRGTTCGLCGNFNGRGDDEFSGPDPSCKNLNLNPTAMVNAYIVRDGNCAGVGSTCSIN